MFRRPSLFIIGAPKSGTSALAAYLDMHPNVFISKPKEPFYWSADYPGLKRMLNLHSVDDYLSLFSEATNQQRVIGEGSTNYLRSNCAIENILDFNPASKMIVMLRNPVDVVHAYHAENHFARWENEPDCEQAWRKQDARLMSRMIPASCPAPQLLQYRSIAAYSEQIERLFEIVPPHQRKVIIFDDFAEYTRSVFDDTIGFLKLSPFEMESFQRVNAAHGHRFGWLAKMVLDPPARMKPAVEMIRKFLRNFQGGLVTKAKMAMRKPQRRKPLRPEFRSELAEHFAPDVARLSNLLDRDLMHWVNRSPVLDVVQTKTDELRALVTSGGKA